MHPYHAHVHVCVGSCMCFAQATPLSKLQCMPRLRRVIHADWGHRSVGGDLLLNFPLFYGQATVGVGTVIIPYIGVAYTRGGAGTSAKTLKVSMFDLFE